MIPETDINQRYNQVEHALHEVEMALSESPVQLDKLALVMASLTVTYQDLPEPQALAGLADDTARVYAARAESCLQRHRLCAERLRAHKMQLQTTGIQLQKQSKVLRAYGASSTSAARFVDKNS